MVVVIWSNLPFVPPAAPPPQITDKDAEALAFLTDVRCEELDTEELKGFRLTFDFKENPFFTNTCAALLNSHAEAHPSALCV